MQVECPRCKRVMPPSEDRILFCGFCGHPFSQTKDQADATTSREPSGADGDTDRTGQYVRADGEDASPGSDGRSIGNYHLLRKLGEGGMGVVWEAEQIGTGRRVALKLLVPGQTPSAAAMERFLREGRLAAALSHPRSTFVFEAGDCDGEPYIAMELMPGRTLKDVVHEHGPLPVNRAVDYLLDVIEGLEAAHALGIIHRDVKPSNCFLDSDGRAKVGDFGLSKTLTRDASLTESGSFVGTPQFAAPEQTRGKDVDQRTDVYALGATLFYLIAGRAIFTGNYAQVIAQIASEPVPSLRSLSPNVPKDLDRIVARTLEKDPERRYATLGQLRQALLPFATGGTSIADLGRRLGAYMVDSAVGGIIAALFAVLAGLGKFVNAETLSQETLQALVLPVLGWLVTIGYFTVAEGCWGRGLGKWSLGLRVVGVTGDPPGVLRTLLRSFFIPGGLGLTVVATVLGSEVGRADFAEGRPTAGLLGSAFYGLLAYVPMLLCLVTMRLRNSYRGLHELASATRVVRLRMNTNEGRLHDVPVLAPVAITNGPRMFGPYRETGVVGQCGQASIRAGRDDILHRPVWIHLHEQGSQGLSAERVALGRPTRARWLQGGQSDAGRWDAFEAIAGAPLVGAVEPGAGLSWERGRIVLLDLAEELRAGVSDGTLPSSLSLEQVWLDRSGRVKLLDHPIQPSAQPTSSTLGPVTATSAAVPNLPAESAPCMERAVKLLRTTATFCTRNQVLPGKAQEFVRSLAERQCTQATLEWAVEQLRVLVERRAVLHWDDRLGILGVVTGTEFTFYVILSVIVAMLSWNLSEDPALVLSSVFIFVLLAPAILGAWFRGGPALCYLGFEVRRRDGQSASRLRCAWRNLVAWIPFTWFYAVILVFAIRQPTTDGAVNPNSLMFSMLMLLCGVECLLLVGLLGLIYGLVRPQRGLQDLLAGTRLVPR